MNEILKVKFLFKSKPFSVSLQRKDYQNLPQPVLLSLLIQQQYEIKSDVKEEIFQSIIEYFVHETVPGIQKDNIDEYDLISKELQLQPISEIIQQKRDFFNNISKIISSISDKSVTDNSSAEHSISKVLDDVIEYYSDELMNLPIQSLYNIFNSNDCNFTSHERLYDLILNHFENNKDYEICMLLQFIDGNKIPEQKLINSINDESLHFGFKPFFDISSLFKKMHELENEKGKQNNKPGKKRNEEQMNDSNDIKDEEQNDNSNDKKDDEQNDNSNDKKDEEQNDNSYSSKEPNPNAVKK